MVVTYRHWTNTTHVICFGAMMIVTKCRRVFVASLWILLLSCSEGEAASLILSPPVNQTVPVNSTAVFSCRVTGVLSWEIDTVQIRSDTARDDFCNDRGVCLNNTLDTSPDETESVLLVAANENNGSEIRCLASETTTSTGQASEVAVLITFDRPAPPTDLISSPVRPLHLNLSWSAPFIFPGTNTNYTISIRNVNTSEEIKREGLEETHYIFNGTGGSSACDVYQFSVAAVNSAGSSNQSRDILRRLPTLPNIEASIESLIHDVVLEDGSSFASIKISFEPAGLCEDPAVASYGVILHGDNTNVIVGESHLEDGRVNIVLTNAKVNVRYSFSIVASNSIGNSTSKDSECYTTDVQDARISMKDGDIVVSCYFAGGSQARGCQIQLNSPMENITLNISRNNACGIIIEPSYSPILYKVCALDWEADGTIGELCVPVAVDLSQSTSCGDPPGPGAGSSTPIWIVAPIIIVGVLLLIATGALVGICIYKQQRKHSLDIDLKDNVAYGPVTPQQRTAIYEEIAAQPEKIEMSGNVAYGQISH